jgi:antitoxin component YwqK of YwqJK toxin-antitoxin module
LNINDLQKFKRVKKLTLVLLAVILSFSFLNAQETINQTDANGLKQGHWIGKYANGTIRYEGSFSNDKPVGSWKRFHANGKLNAVLYHFPNSEKVAAELFDNNGIRFAKGNYIATLKDSIWNYYNNLRLVGQESYSKGAKNGQSFSFFENGNPYIESNWVNGMLSGVRRSFYPSGKKMSETMFKEGIRNGISLTYYESEQIEIKGQYKNDLPDGIWKFNDEKGSIKFELKYQIGKLLNPEVLDSIQENEFKAYDRAKGSLKDPEDFIQNPEDYLRN